MPEVIMKARQAGAKGIYEHIKEAHANDGLWFNGGVLNKIADVKPKPQPRNERLYKLDQQNKLLFGNQQKEEENPANQYWGYIEGRKKDGIVHNINPYGEPGKTEKVIDKTSTLPIDLQEEIFSQYLDKFCTTLTLRELNKKYNKEFVLDEIGCLMEKELQEEFNDVFDEFYDLLCKQK